MARYIFLFCALLIIASFNLRDQGQCLEWSKEELSAGQSLEHEHEHECIGNERLAHTLVIRAGLEDDGHQLFPRGSEASFLSNWQQNIGQTLWNGLPSPLKLDLFSQLPTAFKRITEKCLPSDDGKTPPTENEATKCLIDEGLKIFPTGLTGKIAKFLTYDFINKNGQDIYTPEKVLEAAAECNKLLDQPLKPGESAPKTFSKCFSDAVRDMHPLQQFSLATLKTRATSFFEDTAKICRDKMPKDLKSRRETNTYYSQCFVDTASENYKDNMLVKFGRRALEPYIDNPSSTFNREKILEVAEHCDDQTMHLPPETKAPSAISCFFRKLLFLNPLTKWLASFLPKYEAARSQTTETVAESRPKTPQRPPSSQFGGQDRNISITSSFGRKDTDNSQVQTPQRKSSTKSGGKSRSIIPSLSRKETDNSRVQTPQKQFTMKSDGQGKSIIPLLSRNEADNPQDQKDLIDCVTKAVNSVSLISLATSSVTSVASKIPVVGGNISAPSKTPLGIVQSFVNEVTPCFQFFKRDENGKLVFDHKYMANTALEGAKFNPAAALAIGAAQALAENVTVQEGKDGKQEYKINFPGLVTALGMAAVKSNPVTRLAGRVIK